MGIPEPGGPPSQNMYLGVAPSMFHAKFSLPDSPNVSPPLCLDSKTMNGPASSANDRIIMHRRSSWRGLNLRPAAAATKKKNATGNIGAFARQPNARAAPQDTKPRARERGRSHPAQHSCRKQKASRHHEVWGDQFDRARRVTVIDVGGALVGAFSPSPSLL